MFQLRPYALGALLLAAVPVLAVTQAAVSVARAAEEKTYSPQAFEAAKKSGAPILVEVTAPWCPTCKAQKPILSELLAQPKFDKMTVFKVDFDTQKDALKLLGVQMQSTLISYKGDKEVGRSTGVTEKAKIASQLDKSV